MNKVEAKYFDGQSSVSRQISITLDELTSELCLQTVDGVPLFWKAETLKFERYGSLLEIRNEQHPGVLLQIDDKEFSKAFYQMMKQKKRVDIHERLLSIGFSKIMVIAIGLLGSIVLAYFYVLPSIAEKSAELLPESFDDYLGNSFTAAFLDSNDIDFEKTKYLTQFASELNLENTKPLNFTVVKSNEVNAFAVPNGQIVIYTAILRNMENADELAALLGHEVAHINNRHSAKMLCRNLAGYMLVSLLFSDVNGIMAVVADNAQQLHSLAYSRKFEQEADEQGLQILMNNHINPNGMVKLFEQLEKEDRVSIPQMISTHPLTIERKENMRKIIRKSKYSLKSQSSLNRLFEQLKNYDKTNT